MAEGLHIFYHEDYAKEIQTTGHPESPQRATSIMERLEVEGLASNVIKPKAATKEDIMAVHTDDLVATVATNYEGFMDPDTYHRDYTYELALLAAGGTMQGVEKAYKEKTPTLVIPRPPGHHAGKDFCGGFCYFNNVAIAAQDLLDNKGRKKVAIVDVDVHHGNGTADIFSARKDVLYVSTHQWGIFPGTGALKDFGRGPGEGYTVNLPLLGGMGDEVYHALMDQIMLPVLRQYEPQHIIVSLGLDAHYMDPLATLELTTDGLSDACMKLKGVADEVCESRITFVVEGGYHLLAISETTASLVSKLTGQKLKIDPKYNEVEEPEVTDMLLPKYIEQHSKFWNLEG